MFLSGCSNISHSKPTQFNSDNTATVFIGAENIVIPMLSGFEKAGEKDKYFTQLILNPVPDKDTEVLAVFKKEDLTKHKYFVIVSNPFKSINTDKYTSRDTFNKLNSKMYEAITYLLDGVLSSFEYKKNINKIESDIGLFTRNRSSLNKIIDTSDAFGYSGSFDVMFDDLSNQSSENTFRVIKVSHGTVMLRVKEKMLSVKVVGMSETKLNMNYVESLSKELFENIMNLNGGKLIHNQKHNPSKGLIKTKTIEVNYIEKLREIKELFNNEVIDNEEFKKMKQKIIDKM